MAELLEGQQQSTSGRPVEIPGHWFLYHHRPAAYRAGSAVDGWQKVWRFLDDALGGE